MDNTLTIEEARALYNHGFRDTALKFFSEGQLENDYTIYNRRYTYKNYSDMGIPNKLSMNVLYSAYREISRGREIGMTYKKSVFVPYIMLSVYEINLYTVSHIGDVTINNIKYKVFTRLQERSLKDIYTNLTAGFYSLVESKSGLGLCSFVFKEKDQAMFFVKEFWRELLTFMFPLERIEFSYNL